MNAPEELLNGYFDGALTAVESAELRAWLGADREHMRRFVREAVIHSRLRDVLHETDLISVVYDEALGDTVDPQHIASLLDEEEAAARRRRDAEESVPPVDLAPAGFDPRSQRAPRHQEKPRLAHGLVYAAGAAAAAVVVMAFRQVTPPPMPVNQPVVANPAPTPVAPVIAQVTKGLSAAIFADESEVGPGQQLTSGPLTVVSGVAELVFNSGVRIVVEGPAELSLVSADRAKLLRGRVVVNVPKEALGFTLHSAAAAFVDLGTEFGVEVNESGAASIHVLDGEVAVVADKKGSTPSQMLQRGSASTVNVEGGARDIPFDETYFLRRVPASAYELAVLKSKPLAYWWLDQQHSSAVTLGGGRHPLPARTSAGIKFQETPRGSEASPRRSALFTDNHDGIDIAAHKELGLVNNVTCEAWVLPGDAPSGPRRVFSTFDRPHSGLAIGVVDGGWYKLPQETLRFQLTTYGGYDCISKSPISADRWVHLAATIDQQGGATLYVDGEVVDTVYRVSGETFDTQTFEDIPAVWSETLPVDVGKPSSSGGARIGCNPPGPERRRISPEIWQGGIANVALYDRVLSDREIRAHFQATRDRSVELSSDRP